MEKDTVLIFQRPEMYFFPYFSDIVFPPFRVPEKSLRYMVYKALFILRIPLYTLFWGDWGKRLKEAERVIIFDYGYQAGMENYIRKKNPSCQIYLFVWNVVDKNHRTHELFTDKNAIYCTDRGCCETYHFKYNHIFYARSYYRPYSPEYKNRLFFLGADKGRAPYLHELKGILEKSGLECDIRVLLKSKDRAYRLPLADIETEEALCYDDYRRELEHAGVLLDVNQKGQKALTMRVMEAIYFSKKLITNNEDIVNYDFYQENNIFLLPQDLGLISAEEIRAFLDKPFVPYPEEILARYDFEHWKKQFGKLGG